MSLERPAVDAYNNPLGFNYTADQVDAALRMVGGTTRTMLFRFNLLDKNNKFIKQLSTVTGGSVKYDYSQQIKRTAEFDLQDDGTIDFLSNRIQTFALLYIPPNVTSSTNAGYSFVSPAQPTSYETTTDYSSGGAYAQFPLGVFLLSTAPQQTDNALVVTRQVQGYDLNQILVDWKTTDRYTIAAGTNYISAVQSLLNATGITSQNLTPTTLTLPTALDYKGGTPYLTIINDLLTQMNYRTLWFDENGQAQAQPWVNPSTVAAGYSYIDDSNSVILPQVNRNYDLFQVPNVWVVVVAQTDQATITSTYTNSNTASPTSTVNRGRQIVHFEQNLNAPLSQTLASFAEQIAFNDSQVYETIVYETAIMPMHQDYDVLNFQFSTLGISDNYSELAWSFPFSAGGTMSHTVRKIVPV